MDSAFPTPKIGNIKRSRGQGCSSCVHRKYCDSFRYLVFFGTVVDSSYGVACESWSNNKEDMITNWTEDDIYKADVNMCNGDEQWETSVFKREN